VKQFLEVYIENREKIEEFIEDSIVSISELSKLEKGNFKKIFNTFSALELVYTIDKNTKEQTSVNYYRSGLDEREKGKDRTHLLNKLRVKKNSFAVTSPYRSSATKSTCITVSKKEGDSIICLDFDLIKLLERLQLIELNSGFNKVSKIFYSTIGGVMVLLSLATIAYSLVTFIDGFFLSMKFDIESIFKPIVAITLGLAVFDLAKTILEQEVFFKSYSKSSKIETKVLTKFMVTIIIALSIEALMVVFKIAMDNYEKMINAFYLSAGISTIIIAMSVFIYLTGKKMEQ
jgi:hypothetical protein